MKKVLNYGMVGGGPDGFIGDAHRRAINLDGKAKIVAGCFSRTKEKNELMGKELGICEDRCYESALDMAQRESNKEDGIDFVVIVTPNNSHYEICKAFLEAGINVSCDKPVTVTSKEAMELESLAKENNLLFMVTYTYMGHVTAKHIKEIIKSGEIGEVRTVMAEYPQGWLAHENDCGGKQGEWRCDPQQSGNVNCLGDLGTHVENAVATMTGLKIKKVLAKMDTVVPGHKLDDNDMVLVEYESGATGMYWTSQIAIGHDNGLRVRIYGSKGSVQWFQETPEKVIIIKEDGSINEVHRGYRVIGESVAKYERLPSGHSEGWFEAMANLYLSFMECIKAKKDNTFDECMIDYPTITDGFEGILFVEACLKSSENGNVWIDLKNLK
ncbi:Inositol 2-dehydrogenase/D-chiro-inositol 3-dehydrogenase [Terrisporobacter petrolearius]|uniref:Inositol 2-dehydrogenase/D-chiro-inositol 3-dehydrogenase n=1 Tax=Terrisporobacter petrolearius TaxID=1460447 RepID=A0ABZ3FCH6_9FIRM